MQIPKIFYSSNQAGYLVRLYPSRKGYVVYSGQLKKRFYIFFLNEYNKLLIEYFPKIVVEDLMEKTQVLREQFQSQFTKVDINFLWGAAAPYEEESEAKWPGYRFPPTSILRKFYQDEKMRKEIIAFPFLKYLLIHLNRMEKSGQSTSYPLKLSDSCDAWYEWKSHLSFNGKMYTGLKNFLSKKNMFLLAENEWEQLFDYLRKNQIPRYLFYYEKPLNIIFLLEFLKYGPSLLDRIHTLNTYPLSQITDKFRELGFKKPLRYIARLTARLLTFYIRKQKEGRIHFKNWGNQTEKFIQNKYWKNPFLLNRKRLVPIFEGRLPAVGLRRIRTLNEIFAQGPIFRNCLVKYEESSVWSFVGYNQAMFIKNIPASNEGILVSLDMKERTIICIGSRSHSLNLHVARVCYQLWRSGYSLTEYKSLNRRPCFRNLLLTAYDNQSKGNPLYLKIRRLKKNLVEW
jgi:hypothetical protein